MKIFKYSTIKEHDMPVVSLSKVKMHYLDEGEGFPLVLITGLGGAAENWRGEIDYFKKTFPLHLP